MQCVTKVMDAVCDEGDGWMQCVTKVMDACSV